MEEYNKDAWETLIERCEEVGVDAFEINFSCPHGMPERKMGMAMGQDCDILKVCPHLRVLGSRILGFRDAGAQDGHGHGPGLRHPQGAPAVQGLWEGA